VHVFIVHAHPERRSLNSELKNVAGQSRPEQLGESERSDCHAGKPVRLASSLTKERRKGRPPVTAA
jgi:putative NADPH-quinone reductase